MSAKWQLAVSVGGFWLCSGRLDPQKQNLWCVWVDFSVADVISHFGKCALLRNITAGVGLFVAYVTRETHNRALFYCYAQERPDRAPPQVPPVL